MKKMSNSKRRCSPEGSTVVKLDKCGILNGIFIDHRHNYEEGEGCVSPWGG